MILTLFKYWWVILETVAQFGLSCCFLMIIFSDEFLSRVSQKCFCILSTSHQKANDDKFVPLYLIKFYHLIKVMFARFLSHKVTVLFPFLKRYFETVNILFLITLLPTILVSVDDSWLKNFTVVFYKWWFSISIFFVPVLTGILL